MHVLKVSLPVILTDLGANLKRRFGQNKNDKAKLKDDELILMLRLRRPEESVCTTRLFESSSET